MSNLRLKTLKITDSVEQIAAYGELNLVPNRGTGVGNVRYQTLTEITDAQDRSKLPIIGQRVQPDLYYNGQKIGSLIPGNDSAYVTHADDLTDPDKYSYSITLTAEDLLAPHRRQITFLKSSPAATGPGKQSGASLRLSTILRDFANAANTIIRWTKVPDYDVFGTLEFIQTTPLDVMGQVVAAFNIFDYYKFYPRYVNGLLDYLLIDYSKPPRGAYRFSNVKSVNRTYTRYTNGALIGDQDIIITGGERIKNSESEANDFPNSQVRTKTYHEVQKFTSRTDIQTIAQAENWAETEVSLDIQVQMRRDTPGNWVLPSTFPDAISQLQVGFIDDLNVQSTTITRRVERQFTKRDGLVSETVSTFEYEEKIFSNGVVTNGNPSQIGCTDLGSLFVPRQVLTSETVVNYIFPTGERLATTKTGKTYAWNGVGVTESTTTMSYTYFRDVWVLTNIDVQEADPTELLNATIQFWSRVRSATKGVAQSPPVKRPAQVLTKWRTLNGTEIVERKFRGDDCKEFDATDLLLSGYEMTVPASDIMGLREAFRIATRQRFLEQNRFFWETVTVVVTIDLNIYVGMPVVYGDSSGYVVSVTHEIEEDSAITTVTYRRLRQ